MKFGLSKMSLIAVLAILAHSNFAFSNEIDTAAAKGNVAKVMVLLKANPNLVFDKNVGGYTPLHVAALNGQMDVVKLLLASNADVNAKGGTLDTPLHFAAAYQHYDVVKMLLLNKADPNAKNRFGYSPLRLAMDYGASSELMELLITNKADVNTRDNFGMTPLAEGTRTNIAKLLLAYKADVNAASSSGGTPLYWAASRGQKDLAQILLASNANVNARDNGGRTALVVAVMHGKTAVAELLVASNADVNAEDNDGSTPLEFGFDNNAIAALLRRHGGHGKEIKTKPLVGWYYDGNSDSQHDQAIIEDYQAYAHKVWPKDRDFFIADLGFYENADGRHAVRIELEPGLRYYVVYYLFYDTNDVRTKVTKWKTWHQFSM